MKKRCRRCEQHKTLNAFSVASSNADGYTNTCKSCVCERNKAYWRTPYGRVMYIYSTQCTSSKARGHPAPTYTAKELYQWGLNNGLIPLLNKWAATGYLKQATPSVDRIDPHQGYSLTNIRLVTWDENNQKAYKDRKSCRHVTKQNCKIQQLTLEGGVIATFDSIAQASRVTGVTRTNISPAANPNHPRTQAGNFIWRYQADKQKEAA